jgi:hypothetical protein
VASKFSDGINDFQDMRLQPNPLLHITSSVPPSAADPRSSMESPFLPISFADTSAPPSSLVTSLGGRLGPLVAASPLELERPGLTLLQRQDDVEMLVPFHENPGGAMTYNALYSQLNEELKQDSRGLLLKSQPPLVRQEPIL